MPRAPLHPAWKRHLRASVVFWGIFFGHLVGAPFAFVLLPGVEPLVPMLLLGWIVALWVASLWLGRFACPACGSRFFWQLGGLFSARCPWCALPKWADPAGWPLPPSLAGGDPWPSAPSRDRILLAEVAFDAGGLAAPVAPSARSFRPDLVLADGSRYQAILVGGPAKLSVGDRACVELHAVGEGDYRGFSPGAAFELQDRGRRVGTGRVRGWR